MSWLDTLAEIRKTDWSTVPEEEREATVREVVTMASYAAAAASLVPIPLIDAALLLPIHSAMVMTVGHVNGRNLSDAEAKRVAVELGTVAGVTMAGRAALSAIKKLLLPGVGGVLAAPASFAVTWALGWVANTYFKNPDQSRDELKKVFSEAFREAKSTYDDAKRKAMSSDEEGEDSSPGEAQEERTSTEPEPAPSEKPAASAASSDAGSAETHAEADGKNVRTKKRSL